MIKILLSSVLSFTTLICFAQKQVLTYQDFQYIMQSSPEQTSKFLQQKNYQIQPASAANEIRFFALFADIDYTDLTIKTNGRNKVISITTTHLQQAEDLQKAINIYPNKTSKGFTTYRIKDGKIAKIGVAVEESTSPPAIKTYTILLEN